VAGRDSLFVLCTKPVRGTESVRPAVALQRFVHALWAVPLASGRPVNCTKGWLPPAPAKQCRWRHAGDIPASDQHFDAAIRELEADGRTWARVIKSNMAAVWRFPADVPQEERQRSRERMFGHRLQVNSQPPEEKLQMARRQSQTA
jgi:hypothetical protein